MMAASFSVPNLCANVGDREEMVVVAICVPLESKGIIGELAQDQEAQGGGSSLFDDVNEDLNKPTRRRPLEFPSQGTRKSPVVPPKSVGRHLLRPCWRPRTKCQKSKNPPCNYGGSDIRAPISP